MKRLKLVPLVAIAIIGCLDGTGPRRPGGPNALISDGAHGTTHKFFFFLPPMVPNPSPTGIFNGFLSPAVEICQLAGDENTSCLTTIATFTMTSGPGSVIRVVPADQHYIVNWHTDQSPSLLPSPTIYRIQVFSQLSAPRELLGVADVQLADNGKEAKSLTSNQMIGLVDGRTLPIKFRIEFGAVDLCPETSDPCARATVGTEGGPLVATDDDGVALAFADFPAGWSLTPREVSITQIVTGDDEGVFGPGEGPLEGAPEGVRQYPLFFEYSTDPPGTFNASVRIGVCNVGEEGAFHPPHRETTALALGATADHGFVVLDFAPTSDLLGGCVGVTPTPGGGGGDIGLNRLDGWQGLLARAGAVAANLLAPRALEAVVLVDGGMGGSTEFFSPVGTVDTAPDLIIESLSHSPASPTTADAVTYTAVVKNQGFGAAPASTVGFLVGDVPTFATVAVPALASNATFSAQVTLGPRPAGIYADTARADLNGDVTETDETNNDFTGPVYTVVPVGVDLVSVALSSTTLTIGGPNIPYEATVANGTGGTLSDVFIQAYVEQGEASRAAGGVVVLCGAGNGVLPPGTCSFSFTTIASNATAGTGTLVPGSATVRFELRQGTETVHDVLTIPVTLVSP